MPLLAPVPVAMMMLTVAPLLRVALSPGTLRMGRGKGVGLPWMVVRFPRMSTGARTDG